MANRIQVRRGTAAQWAAANPVLAAGEPGTEIDTGVTKIGDGVTAWGSLSAGKRLVTEAAASATYATKTPTEFSSLIAGLQSGVRSLAWNVIGDSTGNATDEWVHLTAQWLAASFPSFTVKHKIWNTNAQDFDAPIVIQTGLAGERYTYFPGGPVGTGAAIADSALNSITGDLDVRVRVAPDTWATGVDQVMAAKFAGAGARSWRFQIGTAGQLQYDWSADGTTLLGPKSATGWTVPANGTAAWVRVVHDVDNGAGGNDIKFYSSTDGVAWTQVGTTITTAGVTSIFDSTADVQVGARGGFAAAGNGLVGKFYEVQIRNGIDGPLVVPALPEHWSLRPTAISFGGSPVLTIVNASHPGADITYLNDATRRQRMSPDYGQALVTVSCSHNDLTREGATYLADWDSMLAFLRGRFPLSGMSLSTQNPRTAPAANIAEHALRRTQLFGWASRNKVGVIDAYQRFLSSGQPLAALVDPSDGIHPVPAGSVVWSDAAKAALAF